jgi:pantoate--beta-alanine ligase
MRIAGDLPSLRRALAGLGPIALVPTMGVLHAGHLFLLAAARQAVGRGGAVVASILVSPL